jgi:tetratricopeptide (TPR) repeat protein
MAAKATLNKKVFDEIDTLHAEAKAALGRKDLGAAARLSDEAWAKLPEPKFGWDHSYNCLHRLVEFKRPTGQGLQEMISLVQGYIASEYFRADTFGSHFLLGTLYYDVGELDRAFEAFQTADKLSGGYCFNSQDPKFRKFYKEQKDARKKARSKPS